MKTDNYNLLFKLIQVSIGRIESLDHIPTQKQWRILFDIAQQQALTGLLFDGIERLHTKNVICPKDILFQWMAVTLQLEERNKLLNKRSKEIYDLFSDKGFRNCILKGQGAAHLYPHPMRRQSGDIDIWIEGDRKQIILFLHNSKYDVEKIIVHHADTKIFPDVSTEIHFMPIWLYNPIHNWRLQSFFNKMSDEQFKHYDEEIGFCYPTLLFNAVYSLTHIFHHLMDEGIGLRQVIDYYYILLNLPSDSKEIANTVLKSIGMYDFAGAIMYVLKEVCGMDATYMLCKPREKLGAFVLNEIMIAGNFGMYDNRYERKEKESLLQLNERKLKRAIRFVYYFPSEVLFIPLWKCWHRGWRKFHGYI